MKKLIVLTGALVILSTFANAFELSISILSPKFGGREQVGLNVNNDKECKSVTEIGGNGNQIAHILGSLKELDDEAGSGAGPAMPSMVMTGNTQTRSADVDTITDLIKQAQSDYTKAGGDATSEGGDKQNTGDTKAEATAAQGAVATGAPSGSTAPQAGEGTVTLSKEEADAVAERLLELERLKKAQAEKDKTESTE